MEGRAEERKEGERRGPRLALVWDPQRLFWLCSSFKYAFQKYYELSQNNARNVF